MTDDARWAAAMERIANDRDRAAFADLFGHFAPRVKAFLIKSGTEPSLAEECTQEVMTTLWTKAALYDPARATVATWVFTLARNRRIDLIRRQRRPEPEELWWGPEEERDRAEVIGLQQETAQLRAAIRALPEGQRAMIVSAFLDERSHTEIAALTGLPLGTIKSRIRLALDRLRHAMGARNV